MRSIITAVILTWAIGLYTDVMDAIIGTTSKEVPRYDNKYPF